MVMRMKLYVFKIRISNNTFMKFMILLICMLAALSVCSQNIKRQTISTQGTSSVTSSGLIVKQTIGQISATGNFSGKFSV
jgi:cell shape-determining protein MreC